MDAGNMSLTDLDKYIKGFQQMGKWGWLPEMRMALKYCRENAKARIKAGRQVGGWAYPKLALPRPKTFSVGDDAPVGIQGSASKRPSAKQMSKAYLQNPHSLIYAKVTKPKQALKATMAMGLVALEKKKWIAKAKPIYRPVWKVRAKKSGPGELYNALANPSSKWGLHIPGRSFMHFGFKSYVWKFAGKHQFGFAGKSFHIPIRELIGANRKDVDYLEAIMMNGVVNREAKLAAKQKVD